jgi:hypothetical protein
VLVDAVRVEIVIRINPSAPARPRRIRDIGSGGPWLIGRNSEPASKSAGLHPNKRLRLSHVRGPPQCLWMLLRVALAGFLSEAASSSAAKCHCFGELTAPSRSNFVAWWPKEADSRAVQTRDWVEFRINILEAT